MPAPAPPLAFSAHLEGSGEAMYEQACTIWLEGIVCKLQDSPYRSGRTESWLKVKCVTSETLHVVGFIPDRESVASLHLGKIEDGKLDAGKAGTGFTRIVAHQLFKALAPLATPRPMLPVPAGIRKTVWVKPTLKVQIEHRGYTGQGGVLRAAAFKGVSR